MIIVTGGAGFIGSNIVKGLNERGRDDILVVDNLTNMIKFKNIQGLKVMDYMDKIAFGEAILDGMFDHEKIDVIFHEDTPAKLIKTIRPDILVKGGDYRPDQVAGREYAGKVEIIEFEEGYSTTGLVERIAGMVREGKL